LLAYDGATQSIYVAVPPSSVDIAPANFTFPYPGYINVTVPVGSDPFGVAYDNASGDVFVTNTGSDNVSVLSGNLSAPIDSIPVGSEPLGVAYNPINGFVYVADNGSANVTVINATNLSVVTTIRVGSGPLGVAVNPNTGAVFVADSRSNAVTEISGTTEQVVATVEVGIEPYGVAVDNVTGDVYVTNAGSWNISVLSSAGTSVIATISVSWTGQLEGITYDWGDGDIWVAAGWIVIVVSPSNQTVLEFENFDPAGLTYASNNGDVCGTNTANRTFECIEFDSDPYGPIPYTFTETGLPQGAIWTLNDCNGPNVEPNSTGVTIYTGYYAYDEAGVSCYNVPPVGPYFATPLTAVSCVGTGLSNCFTVTFYRIAGEYPVTFEEGGLLGPPEVPGWSVTLGGVTNSSYATTLTFPEANGTYTFTIPPVNENPYGYWTEYYPNPCNGTVVVSGGGVEEQTDFLPSSSICQTIQFQEIGLPNGLTWNVTLNSVLEWATTPTSTVDFVEPPGNYSFAVGSEAGYSISPIQGTVSLNGSEVDVNLTFISQQSRYPLTFEELGLPSGSNWSVSLAGAVSYSTTASIIFSVGNGTYSYQVTGPYDYSATPGSGSVTINGTRQSVSVSFISYTPDYAVFLNETGLAAQTNWTACVLT